MSVYSHSQLSTYEECPLKFKLRYRDRIKRETEGVEAFVGSVAHETLKKCYDDIRLTKLNSLDDLLSYYEYVWQKNWHDAIIINKKDVTAEHYRNLGAKMLTTYYQRYAPFSADITIGTELLLNFTLDDQRKYRVMGFIDRLSRDADGVYSIHDYKTSAHLPAQAEADQDRQLALYQFGVQQKWPDIKQVRLVWHYLAFDHELVSRRSNEAIATLVASITRLIDEIESAREFPPGESELCDWCEYPDLCPRRKHLYLVANLPVNQYLSEPGVALVNKYAALKQQSGEIEKELDEVKEALLNYARKEGVSVIRGNDRQVRVRFDMKLRFPGKNETEHAGLRRAITEAGKWLEVSQLDATALVKAVENETWDKALIDRVMQYGKLEEAVSITLSGLKETEE